MAIISKINSKYCNWHPTVYNCKVSRSVKWSRSKGSDNTSASCNPGHAAGDLKDPKGGCFVEGGSSRLLTEPNSTRTGSLQTEKVVFDFRILPGRLNPSVYRTLSESTSFTPFCGESYTNLNLEDTALSSHGTQIILLPLGSYCRDRLNTVEIGFRVGKLFAQVDLQAPLFVSDSVFDEDRFADYPGPE